MNTRPIDLPDFSDPPVVETVLSVQFEPLENFRAAHFGIYWERIKDRFPNTEERAELAPAIEQFPRTSKGSVGIRLESLEVPPLPRLWFTNASGTELIQLQKDRFIKNWRKSGDVGHYPRYENVKAGFEQEFATFLDFVEKQGIGPIRVNQCEVTYVNHIIAGAGWTQHTEADKVFTSWTQSAKYPPGVAEDVAFQASFTIPGEDSTPIGRLHASMQSAFLRSTDKAMFVFNLTARGQIGTGTKFFDHGRQSIVKSFTALTTPAMHRIWGLKE